MGQLPQLVSEPAEASAAAAEAEPMPDRFPEDQTSGGKKASKWGAVQKKLKGGVVTVEVSLFKPAGETLGYSVIIEDGCGLRISGKVGAAKSRKSGATVQDAAAAAIAVAAAEAAGERIAPVSDTSPAEDEDDVAVLKMYDLIVAVNGDDVTGVKSMKELKVILDKHRPTLRFSVERKQAGFQFSSREGGYVPSPPKTWPDDAPAVKPASASAAVAGPDDSAAALSPQVLTEPTESPLEPGKPTEADDMSPQQQYVGASDKKRAAKAAIKAWEVQFEEQNGRRPSAEDRKAVKGLYKTMKQAKAELETLGQQHPGIARSASPSS